MASADQSFPQNMPTSMPTSIPAPVSPLQPLNPRENAWGRNFVLETGESFTETAPLLTIATVHHDGGVTLHVLAGGYDAKAPRSVSLSAAAVRALIALYPLAMAETVAALDAEAADSLLDVGDFA